MFQTKTGQLFLFISSLPSVPNKIVSQEANTSTMDFNIYKAIYRLKAWQELSM